MKNVENLKNEIQQVKNKIETLLNSKKYTVIDVIEYTESRDVIIMIEDIKFNISISDSYMFSDEGNWIKIPYDVLRKYKDGLIIMSDYFLLNKAKEEQKNLSSKIEELKSKIWNA